jgi:hypothetical protein
VELIAEQHRCMNAPFLSRGFLSAFAPQNVA